MPVSSPVLVLLVALATLTAVGVAAGVMKVRFLARTPSVSRRADLKALKRLAAFDMTAALAALGVTASAVLLFATSTALGWMSTREAVAIGVAWCAVFLPLGLWNKLVEANVKAVPVSGHLQREADRVIHVWTARPFPPRDWFHPAEDDPTAVPDPVPIDVPPFGRLTWDEYQWTGAAVLPAWAGFQDRSGPYTGFGSEEPSDGRVRVYVAVPDEEYPTPPTAGQVAAFRDMLDRGEAVRDAVLAAVANYIADHDGGDPPTARELGSQVGVGNVYVGAETAGGYAYVGFELGAEWDEEHGIGVLTHKGRVVDVGPAETAWDFPPGDAV